MSFSPRERIPINSFLLKVTNRCNFNCKRCYFRHHADQSYVNRPDDMSLQMVSIFAEQLGDYARLNDLDSVDILFHGGEPLLRGVGFFDQAARDIRCCLPARCTPRFALQTNASLLTADMIECFYRNEISLSVSLDGPRVAQDRHRRQANGESSYDIVIEKIRLLQEHRWGPTIFSGVLAVVDLRDSPEEIFAFHKSIGVPSVDYLWPDGTYDTPPPGISSYCKDTKYARWSASVFDIWFEDGSGKPAIRFFENALSLLLGGKSSTEGLGPGELSLVTIQTDGEIQDSDILAVAFENAGRFGSGFYLGTNGFEDVTRDVSFVRRAEMYTVDGLCNECRKCVWRDICCGGMLPHRYSSSHGFNAPSIYCSNIKYLLKHIREIAAVELARADAQPLGVVLPESNELCCDGKINDMAKVAEFLARWDETDTMNTCMLPPGLPLRSHVNIDNDISNPTAHIVSKNDPKFLNCLESGIADACILLISRLGLVTYSSCQGHVLQDGTVRERSVGILPRSKDELHWATRVLRDIAKATCIMTTSGVALVVEEDVLCDTDAEDAYYRTIDLRFTCSGLPPQDYFEATEVSYEAFLCVLKFWTRNLSPSELAPAPPFYAEEAYSRIVRINCERSAAATQISFTSQVKSESERRAICENVRKVLCSCNVESIQFTANRCDVTLCATIYPDESMVVRNQIARSDVVVVQNHAWALLAWEHSLRTHQITDSVAPIWITRFDAHTDMMSPLLGVEDDGITLRNLLSREISDPDDYGSEILGGAIAPGSFTLPFLFNHQDVTVDYAAPEHQLCLGAQDHLPSGFYNVIGLLGSCILAPDAKGLVIQPDVNGSVHWSVGLCMEKTPPPSDDSFWILDIDCDYFNNFRDGRNTIQHDDNNSDAACIAATRLDEMLDWLRHLQRLPNLVTIALSPDFCAPRYCTASALEIATFLRPRMDIRGGYGQG